MIKVVNTNITRIGYDFYADVAERIVESRKKAGLTQEQLSKKANIPLSRVSRYESVQVRFKKSDLEVFSKAFGVTLDWLIGAEYDDQDGKECLYTVCNERKEGLSLYFKATSPQMAFLNAYDWSLKHIVWFEPRERAIVELVGVPLRKTDYIGKFKERTSSDDDPIEK